MAEVVDWLLVGKQETKTKRPGAFTTPGLSFRSEKSVRTILSNAPAELLPVFWSESLANMH